MTDGDRLTVALAFIAWAMHGKWETAWARLLVLVQGAAG